MCQILKTIVHHKCYAALHSKKNGDERYKQDRLVDLHPSGRTLCPFCKENTYALLEGLATAMGLAQRAKSFHSQTDSIT